jgi:hypothetical protein
MKKIRLDNVKHSDFNIFDFKKIESKKYEVEFTSKYGNIKIPCASSKRKEKSLLSDFFESFENWPVQTLGYEMIKKKKKKEAHCKLVFYGTFKDKVNCLKNYHRTSLKSEIARLHDDRKKIELLNKKCDETLRKIIRHRVNFEKYNK